MHHELWRDEVRALSIAMEANSVLDLPVMLKNEGHPVLWYVLLYAGYAITGSKLILPALSIMIAFAAVLLFIKSAPFPLWQKVLFIFSYLPFYEYSVMCRNYGISMLLLFSFAHLYTYRKRYPLLPACVLLMLAFTNAHSIILSVLLLMMWCWDSFFTKSEIQNEKKTGLSLYVCITLIGLSMFVFLIFTHCYQIHNQYPFLPPGLLLWFSLANTPSIFLFCFILLIWGWHGLYKGSAMLKVNKPDIRLIFCFALILVSILISGISILPEKKTIATGIYNAQSLDILKSLIKNIIHLGQGSVDILPSSEIFTVYLQDFLTVLLIAGLLVRISISFTLFLGILCFGIFFEVIYAGAIRHQGLLLIFIITLYWIIRRQDVFFQTDGMRKNFHNIALYGALSFILLGSLHSGGKAVLKDINLPFSSSKSFGLFMNDNPQLKDAIILSEKGAFVESLHYYLDNKTYFPREGRFGKTYSCTTDEKQILTLHELLSISKHIGKKENKAVLILLENFNFSNDKIFEKKYIFNKIFKWSSEELTEFYSETFLLHEFQGSISGENFKVYLLKQ